MPRIFGLLITTASIIMPHLCEGLTAPKPHPRCSQALTAAAPSLRLLFMTAIPLLLTAAPSHSRLRLLPATCLDCGSSFMRVLSLSFCRYPNRVFIVVVHYIWADVNHEHCDYYSKLTWLIYAFNSFILSRIDHFFLALLAEFGRLVLRHWSWSWRAVRQLWRLVHIYMNSWRVSIHMTWLIDF